MTKRVSLFFYVNGQFLLHACSLDKAEVYEDYLTFPKSHFEVWERFYSKRYKVDFDYYPRGRVVYNISEEKFHILYDRCIGKAIRILAEKEYQGRAELGLDEHYQCYRCNEGYIR